MEEFSEVELLSETSFEFLFWNDSSKVSSWPFTRCGFLDTLRSSTDERVSEELVEAQDSFKSIFVLRAVLIDTDYV